MDNDQEKIASEQRGDAAACGPSPGPGCSALNRFAFDEESGFVIDRETGEWLTTAEDVFYAMIQHMPNPTGHAPARSAAEGR